MPEGPTIKVTADQLKEALEGEKILRFSSPFKKAATEEWASHIEGQEVVAVRAHGKNLFIDLANGWVLYSHMLMWGAWHVYNLDEPWRKEASKARVVLETATRCVVLFSAPVCQLIHPDALASHQTSGLGPDLLKLDFQSADLAEIRRRLDAQPDLPIGVAIMDQTIMAGIGNILKSEILFAANLNPLRPYASLSEEEFARLLNVCLDFMRRSYQTKGFSEVFLPPALRQATGKLGYVYQRRGQPCLRCGEKLIMLKQGRQERLTFYCPLCQPLDPDNPPQPQYVPPPPAEELAFLHRVKNAAQARDFILAVGICSVFTNGTRVKGRLPSLWDVAAPEVDQDDKNDYAARMLLVADWRNNLAALYPQEIFCGKIKGSRPVLMSMSKLAELYATNHKELTECSALARQLYDLVANSGPMTTIELRSAAGMSARNDRPIFMRALDELEISFNLVRSNHLGLNKDTWMTFAAQYPHFMSQAA